MAPAYVWLGLLATRANASDATLTLMGVCAVAAGVASVTGSAVVKADGQAFLASALAAPVIWVMPMLFPAVDTVPVTWGLFSALVRRAGTAQVASNSLALVVATAPTTVYATMPHATVSLAMTVLGAKS